MTALILVRFSKVIHFHICHYYTLSLQVSVGAVRFISSCIRCRIVVLQEPLDWGLPVVCILISSCFVDLYFVWLSLTYLWLYPREWYWSEQHFLCDSHHSSASTLLSRSMRCVFSLTVYLASYQYTKQLDWIHRCLTIVCFWYIMISTM